MKKSLLILFIVFVAQYSYGQIYYGENKLTTSRITGTKVGNVFGAVMTYGLSPANSSKIIEGATSETQIKDKKPSFKFHFGESKDSLLMDEQRMDGIFMVKLRKKKKKAKTRQLRSGSYGLIAGVQTGVDEDYVIPLNIEKDGDKTFIVRPKTELEEGEYCFFYIGKDIETTAVYDFTIIK